MPEGRIGRLWAELGLRSTLSRDIGREMGVARAESARGTRSIVQGLGGLKQVGTNLTRTVTLPLLGIGGAAAKSAIDFESAFAGVRKTVDATKTQFARLRTGILEMSRELPATKEEIAGVAEAAGQLGVRTGAIMGFTRTMIDLGESTNLAAQDAANALARLANITQMPHTEFDHLGATVVALGNKLATTEAELVEMGLRIAGAGKQIGLSEHQVLGFAGALASVGINAEAGGTAISRVFLTIQKDVLDGGKQLRRFAAVAGMSASEFATVFKRDAAGATIAFIEGLERLRRQGVPVASVLKDLKLGEIRVRDALMRAAGAGDLFRRSMKIGSDAWRENNALTREASERYKTTESRLKILRNRIMAAAIPLGESLVPAIESVVGVVAGLAEGFADLSPMARAAVLTLMGLAAAAGPVLRVAAAFARLRAAMTVTKVASAALAGTSATTGVAGVASKVGLLARVASPAGLAVTAIAAALWALHRATPTVAKGLEIFRGGVEAVAGAEKRLKAAQQDSRQAQRNLNRLRREGKTDTDAYAGAVHAAEQAERDIALAQRGRAEGLRAQVKGIEQAFVAASRMLPGASTKALADMAAQFRNVPIEQIKGIFETLDIKPAFGQDLLGTFLRIRENIEKVDAARRRAIATTKLEALGNEASADTWNTQLNILRRHGDAVGRGERSQKSLSKALKETVMVGIDYALTANAQAAAQGRAVEPTKRMIRNLQALQLIVPGLSGQIQGYIDKLRGIPPKVVTQIGFGPFTMDVGAKKGKGKDPVTEAEKEIKRLNGVINAIGGGGGLTGAVEKAEKEIVVFAGLTESEFKDWAGGVMTSVNSVSSVLDSLAQRTVVNARIIAREFGKQASALDDLNANIRKAIRRGLPDALLKELLAMGTEGAAILAALAGASGKEFDRIIRNWRRLQRERGETKGLTKRVEHLPPAEQRRRQHKRRQKKRKKAQHGGRFMPFEDVVVGEVGPEIARSTPTGGMEVFPERALETVGGPPPGAAAARGSGTGRGGMSEAALARALVRALAGQQMRVQITGGAALDRMLGQATFIRGRR